MTFSTLSQVFFLAKNIAAQTSIETYYNRDIQVTSNGRSSYYTCKYGNADSVIVYCPYQTVIAFDVLLSLWVIYFGLYIAIRIYVTIFYQTNDLRFYIASEKFNGHVVNQCFVYFGLILTLVCVCVSIYYMSPESQWNPNLDTPNLLNVIVFFGINILSLSKLNRKSFISNEHLTMSDFPEPIPLTNPYFWKSVDDLVKPIMVAYLISLKNDNDDELRRFGRVDQLHGTINKLFNIEKVGK